MANLPFRIVMASALALAVAGCAKKKPAELPPPPASGPADTGADTSGTSTQTGDVPGSRADFLRQAGTDTVYFVTDSHDIDSEAQAILLRQAQWLARNPRVRVTVEGHADERGTREYNLALGDRRANSAKNFLAANGVDAGRISVISYGKERPAATGSDESAWAQNRRAVTVVPVGGTGF
ncbi:peptidoglycan-associated lipoprotein Pal [Sphingomonas jatrophae]|uniref:Peptidoglycan-associated lipoprotein n=1 Tax=Sphingomonas jatrophae TaxID=1166337 RepID=A0A1I6LLH6_9SPHN|nr:peptidoglycan-associated lipoprotein Pal [Sphingomonas jatrophae]SFS04170.1 peptidoglycan-associated lipoprotein [Sphingomonas jatrophae]